MKNGTAAKAAAQGSTLAAEVTVLGIP